MVTTSNGNLSDALMKFLFYLEYIVKQKPKVVLLQKN
ncbi:hypothetical protein GYH30_046842 [Glycine max]|nr:hypothetical protein GYH30_046842 [Glycine max]